ncbi:MAG: CHAD domain-containing protein, partial [Nocardioidaceae bacterium]
REWEVELLQGEASLLDAADELVRDAGAVPARGPSKLSRVLGDRIPKTSSRTQGRLRRGGSAASVVHARLGEQVAELKVRDPQVRRDLPDAVHKMRVAMRRLRSALATFRPLLDTSVTEPLREELKWASGVLGEARDAEVMHERLRSMITAQPPELVLGAVNRRVDDELGRAYRDAHAASVDAMDSQRYLTLLGDLDALVAEPPWTARAEQPARDVLPARVQNDWKRLRRRVSMADNAPSQTERDQRLHDVRKAAKRVRYAAETLIPIYGDSAEQLANATKQVQSVLGEHQDSVVTVPVLRQLGVQAHLDGDNGFTYGLLLAHEQGRTAETETRYAVVRDKASRKRLRRWLS